MFRDEPRGFEITNTNQSDLPFIFQLFDRSIKYQEKNGYPVWCDYDQGAIIKDIENKNQYKIVVDSVVAIVFSVCYTDKVIWRMLDKGDSVYLHRIVVNPAFKGRRLFGLIMEWSIEHAKQKGLLTIRMDTWAANPTLVKYYLGFGFTFMENYLTPNTAELPVHNRNLELTLLEYKI